MPEIAQVDQQFVIPAHLAESGRDLWESIVNYAKPWLAPSDMPSVQLACELADRRTALNATLVRDGLTYQTENGRIYTHPAAIELRNTEKLYLATLSALGLTPTDRARLGLVKVKTQSKLESFLGESRG